MSALRFFAIGVCSTFLLGLGFGCGAPASDAPPAPAAAPAIEKKVPEATGSPTPTQAPAPAPAPVLAPLRVVGQYPLPGEPLTDRFVLYFSEPISATVDAAGAPVPAVSTSPPLPLTLTVAGNYISATFEASALTRPANYDVVLNTALRSAAGAALDPNNAAVRFNVPVPDGAMATGLGVISRSETALALQLKFSLPMNLEALKENLRVTDAGGAALTYELSSIEGSNDVKIAIGSGPKLPVSVSVFAGVPDATGTSPMRSAAAFSYPDATNGQLKFTSFRRGTNAKDSLGFLLTSSSAISAEALQAALKVTDPNGQPVNATVSAAPNQWSTLDIQVPASAGLPLKFAVPNGLLAADGGAILTQDYLLQFPDNEGISVTQASWVVEETGESFLNLTFSAPVTAGALNSAMQVRPKEGGDPFKLEAVTSAGATMKFRLLDAPPEAREARVTIVAGLEGGALAVMKTQYETVVARQAATLNIEYADWESRGKDGPALRLDLNQPVDLVSMKSAISFMPPVDNVSVSSTWTRGIVITGDFASKASYTLRVGDQAKNQLGDPVVKDAIEYPLNESPTSSGAGFDFDDKYYYPRRTAGIVPLQTRNLDEVKVSLSQLFPSNIHVALASMEDGKTWDDFEGRWAKTIAEKTIKVQNTPDKRVTLPLDLKEMMPPDTRGVFGLQLSPGSNNYSTKIVVWTNIGLLAHWVNDEIVVFAHDLFSLVPIPGAKITVWSAKNQMMATTTTDDQGVGQVRGLEKSLGVPSLVVVETGDDFTFLKLAPRSDDAVPVTEDMPKYDRTGYDAFMYSDRGLYRPGELIHARWIGRTNYGDALQAVPLQFELMNPKGSKLQTQAVTLSALGTGGLEIQTDRAWMTGKYTLSLKVPGNTTPVGTMQVNLEDFVPNRIKTDVAISGTQWMVREEQKITVTAENLFGGPASNRTATGNVILRKGKFEHPDLKGFSFTNDVDYMPEILPLGEAQTDDAGSAAFTFAWQGSPKVSFPVQAVVRGEVSELGGRAVADTKEVLLLASSKLLGVNVARGGSGDVVDITVAAVGPDGAPAAVPSVKVTLEREDWSYYVRRYSSYNEPKFTKTYAPVETREVALTNGRGNLSVNLPEYSWGYFRVRVSSSTTPMTSSQSFYKTWDGIELTETPRPSLIKLVLDKPTHNVGEEARVRIESPFDGRAVVVVQGDQFYRVLTAEVKDGAGEVSFPLDVQSAPNVWAEATVVHVAPKERMQVYPYSSFAMINVPVQDPARRIEVTLPGLPEEVRPAQEIQVAVETHGADGLPASAEVTVAAVDEGIHGILGYDNPDPWNYLQRSRQPDFRRAHFYDRVAYDFTPESIGGDLAARLAKRGSTIGDNWIKPVALWSGTITTDADGKGLATFSVPEFNGQLRLVAVAAGSTATGAGSKNLYVRRPYILQASLPRFALPGDTFTGRATVFNTTDAPVTARVSWSGGGTITTEAGQADIAIAPKTDGNALAQFAAAKAVGQGSIAWQVEIVDAAGTVLDTLKQDMPLPVRPPAAYQLNNELAVLKAGETKEFTNTFFVDDEQLELTLTVGNDPALRITNALKSLVDYPHGCVEQTTSRCLPLYLVRKSSALVDSTLAENAKVDVMLKQGIARLFSMQVAGGGLGYWPGATSPNRYGSVYALHFLALVQRDREIPLPESNFKALQEYVRLVGNETSDSSSSGLYLRAYAHYVLALNGDAEALKQIERFDGITMPSSARYLLAAAIALNTNDPERVKKYLATAPSEEYIDFERGGTLNSETRNAAVKLLALVQMGAGEAQLAPLVDTLTRYLSEQRYYVTQEAAFVCAALGTYLERFKAEPGAAMATVTGPDGAKELRSGEHTVLRHKGPGGKFTVANTGTASVYVNFAGAGLPLTPATEATAEGVKLARAVKTASGALKEDSTYAQGDTYVVELSVEAPTALENLVLVDLLPAGFEIENPRLDDAQVATADESEEGEGEGGEGEGSRTVEDNVASATPSYLDVRDDRLVLAFNKLPEGSHTFRYLVRAVTPGAYQQPGAVVECMYDAKVRANLLPTNLEVK
jgi:uncharacterized protein YfaS (alpha-2-macroglobulin family)